MLELQVELHPESLESIFSRFEQVRATSERVKGGTRLGLTVCKEIVRAHHGRIGVDSVEGAGDTFWFCLPKDEEASSVRKIWHKGTRKITTVSCRRMPQSR